MIYKFTDEQKEEQKMQTSITKISMRLNDENAEVKAYASIVMEIKFLIKKFNDPKFLKYDVVQANNQA